MLLPLWTVCMTLTLLSDMLKLENNQWMWVALTWKVSITSQPYSIAVIAFTVMQHWPAFTAYPLLLIKLLKMTHSLDLGLISDSCLFYHILNHLLLLSALTTIADILAGITPAGGLSPEKTALPEHIIWSFSNMYLYFELSGMLSHIEVVVWLWIFKWPREVFKKRKKVSLDLDSLRPCGFFSAFGGHLVYFCVDIFSMAGEPVGHCGIFSQLNLLLLMLMKLVALGLYFTLAYCHFCSRSQRWLYPLHLRCSLSTFCFSTDIAPELRKCANYACLDLLIGPWIYSLQFILLTVWWSSRKFV